MSEHTQPRVHEIRVCSECCGMVESNYRGRWECFEHGDSITVNFRGFIELDPMLDMLERLTASDIDTQEDGGADAIRLLREHGRLGQPVVSPDEGAELESGWA